MSGLTHFNETGNLRMVDVSTKDKTLRIARAAAEIIIQPSTLKKIRENNISKGDTLTAAKIAGTIAAKNTAALIPLCHSLNLTDIDINFKMFNDKIEIYSTVKTVERTGVEMEALAAVSAAALTIYDMLKAIDKTMCINGITLIEKSGGKELLANSKVLSVNTSAVRGKKTAVEKAELLKNFGITGDVHAAENSKKQISILTETSFKKIADQINTLEYGAFGENIIISGVELEQLNIGAEIVFQSGAKLMITEHGKVCHTRCAIYDAVGDCVMPREGIFAKVLESGIIKKNDICKVINYETNNNNN